MDHVDAGRLLRHEGTWHRGTAYADSGAPACRAARQCPGAGDSRVSFPERGGSGHTTPGRDYDGYWLVIRVAATDGKRHWSATHASLLTWEVERLAQWLRAVADGTAEMPTVFAA